MRWLAGLFVALSFAQLAAASEWQYCLAPSPRDHKLYISGVFPVTAPRDSEFEFMESLKRSRLDYEDVQCPRSGDQTSAIIMLQHTIGFNRKLGNEVVTLPWQPAP
jgi:hypothetical protein